MTLDAEPIKSIEEIMPLAESFCKAVLHHLKMTTNLQEVPITVKEQFDFNENSIVISSVSIRSYQFLFQKKCPLMVIADFEESIPFIRSLFDKEILTILKTYDSNGNTINSTFDNSFPILLKFVVEHLIIEYLQAENTFDYHSDKFTKLFMSWFHDQITPIWHEVTIPLIGFTSSISQADVIDGFKICAFSNESKSKLFNDLQSISLFYDRINFLQITHYLTIDCKQDGDNIDCKQDGDNEEKAGTLIKIKDAQDIITDLRLLKEENAGLSIKDVQDIITGLRLLKEGLIGARSVLFFKHPRRKNNQPTASDMGDFYFVYPDGRYEFLDTDIKALIEIVKHLKKVQKKHDKYLNIALRRFNLSYTRTLPEDRLIDLTISLESTVLADERDELKYRLALRGSFLLRNIRTPEETNNILKKMYDIRSAVVHNGSTISDFVKKKGKIAQLYNDKEFLYIAENVTREILREYVQRSILENKDIPSINKEIDEQLLRLMSGVKKPE